MIKAQFLKDIVALRYVLPLKQKTDLGVRPTDGQIPALLSYHSRT